MALIYIYIYIERERERERELSRQFTKIFCFIKSIDNIGALCARMHQPPCILYAQNPHAFIMGPKPHKVVTSHISIYMYYTLPTP
jgi:hypothetical protein